MRVVREEVLIDRGNVGQTQAYKIAYQQVIEAISFVVWPPGASQFTIHPENEANGVLPIKIAFQSYLREHGWVLESKVDVLATVKRPGPIDATFETEEGYFAVEWETGNISSSHRSLY